MKERSIIAVLWLSVTLYAQIDTTFITGGTITIDSTWTKAKSPYVISGDVQINEGATLTIEQGVRVLFERYDENNMWNPGYVDLIVDGTLKAIGSETDSIYFEDINGQLAYNSWASIAVQGKADLKYAVIKHARHQGLYLTEADSVTVTNSLFSSCSEGIRFQHQNSQDTHTHDNIKVEHNTFIDNDRSIVYNSDFGACLIQYNDFYSSHTHDIEVKWWWTYGGNFSAHYNNFHNNITIIFNQTYDPVDMRYNYWGPAATAEMNTGDNPKDISRIDDYYDENRRGKVDYSHWLDAPWPGGQAVDGNYSSELLLTDNQYQDEALTYHAGDSIFIQIADPDRNGDDNIPEWITLDVWSELETTHETVTLDETDPATGIFQGYIPLDDAGVPTADGQLQVNHGDWMYFRYIDPANDWGQADTVLEGRVYELKVTSGYQIFSAETWTVAEGPYLLTGDVQINQGGSLTIEPGVKVYFEPYCDDNDWRSQRDVSEIFVMGGVLTAVGTVTDSIIFQSHDPSPEHSQWEGISFSGDSEAGSIIQYARIEGAGQGAVSIGDGSPQVLNVLFKNNDYGIHISGGSDATPLIRNCTITQSVSHGIMTWSHAVIDSNDIYDNSQGIYIHGYGIGEFIRYNNIYDNRGGGISIAWGSSPDTIRITGNNIHDNGDGGVGIHSQHLIRLRNNNIYANNSYDIENNRYSQVDARFNYWGSTATAEMNAGGNPKNISTIYDYYDDPSRGMVNYAYWLDAPWPGGNPAAGGYTGELNFIHSDGADARGYSEGDTLFLRLYDPDLNLDINIPEVAQVEVWSGLETMPEILYLNEVEADAGLFRGWMQLDGVSGYPMTDGVLQVDMNNWIRAAYSDALDDWLGTAAISDSVQYNPGIIEYESDEHTVLLLHFNEGSGQIVNDASSYANHGHLGDSAGEDYYDAHWSSRGIAGGCLYFDGASSILRIPHNPSLNISGGQITIEMWVNFPSVSPDDWLVSKSDDYLYLSMGLYLEDGRIFRSQFAINNENHGWSLSDGHPIELNRWYHIALTYNGSDM
ncbi:MAG: right-handed parallel beta-helix repeat-containing protein, partial [Candidatus Neomarinimicrobiota bacterium]